MKKSKLIIGCIISVMAFALTLLIGLPSKVYASETSDYIDEKYSNLVFSNNLCGFNNDSKTLSSGSFEINLDSWDIFGSDNGTHFWIPLVMPLSAGTYTFNVQFDGESATTAYELYTYETFHSYESRTFIQSGSFGSFVQTIESEYNITGLFFLFSGSINGSLKFMLNKGSYALPYEPYITGSMIYEQAFNKGVEEASNNNGIWKYIRNVYVGTEEDNNYNLSELKSRGFLSGYEMSLYSMSLVANESYSTIYIDFEFTSAPLTELDFFFKGYNSYTMNIYDEDGEVVNIDVSSLTALNYEDILRKNSNFGNYIDTISIVASSPDALETILNNSSYSEGFQNGYSGGFISGKNEGYSQGFNSGLQDEANNKVHYEEGYEDGTLSGYNEGYNEGMSSNIETNGFKTLFNSILSYPVNLISNVLDFEFMGVNIASLIMFIVSIGIVVFVVKKFW